jgi:hypothetical protein
MLQSLTDVLVGQVQANSPWQVGLSHEDRSDATRILRLVSIAYGTHLKQYPWARPHVYLSSLEVESWVSCLCDLCKAEARRDYACLWYMLYVSVVVMISTEI